MAVQKLKVVLLGILLIVATKATTSQVSTLPGCPESYGSVKIPYPFGTTPRCYYDTSFRLTCNQTFNPPKLVFHGSKVSIVEISLEHREILVESNVSRDCYDEHGKMLKNQSSPVSYMVTYSQFPVSTRNKFTSVGWNYLRIWREALRHRMCSAL